MSSEAREWVWERSSSRGTARLVMLSIADRVADEQCIAWASLSSLAKRTGASISTVRSAIERLRDAKELEQCEDYTAPQHSTVYRLPLAALALADAAANREEDVGQAAESPEDVRKRRLATLRRCGIHPREEQESSTGVRQPAVPETGRPRRKPAGAETGRPKRKPAGAETGRPKRKPAHRRTGNTHTGVAETGTQNRSEPDVNRRYSRSGAAVVVPADGWQVDSDTHAWALRQGHLDRLGEEGLRAADAKWRAHRADHKPRTVAAWAADWRSWIAREHAPSRPGHHAAPRTNTGVPAGMTRAEAHTAALLAALDEPTGSEG